MPNTDRLIQEIKAMSKMSKIDQIHLRAVILCMSKIDQIHLNAVILCTSKMSKIDQIHLRAVILCRDGVPKVTQRFAINEKWLLVKCMKRFFCVCV